MTGSEEQSLEESSEGRSSSGGDGEGTGEEDETDGEEVKRMN
ncbi:unnamed protein product, partial [Allacma fusca]